MMATNSGPLTGITVLDLTRVLAGPYCTMMLADLGARVIKIERPDGGDDARSFGPFIDKNGVKKSAYFMSLNRGKESIALNLKAPEDRAIFEDLLSKADVLVENYRPGVMQKLGYGYEALSKSHPRLIYAAVSGFGHTGPFAQKPAYDMVVQAMGGIMSVTGHPGGEPTRVGSSIGDITAGMFTATGITSALYERERTGKGQKIDVGMMDGQVAILENAIARYQATGESPGPLGARHPSITPFSAFRTQDGHMVIAAGNNALFEELCAALSLPQLPNDPRFKDNDARTQNWDDLLGLMEQQLTTKPTAHWLDALEAVGVPCGPIHNVEEALTHPQTQARNMVVQAEDKDVGTLGMAGNPIKLSNHPDPNTRTPAPDLDADRDRILGE
mgnify:CR=1 FL=1